MSKNTTIRIGWTSSEGYEVDMRRSRDGTNSRDKEETKEEMSHDEKSQEQSQGMVPYNGTQDDANGSNWMECNKKSKMFSRYQKKENLRSCREQLQ